MITAARVGTRLADAAYEPRRAIAELDGALWLEPRLRELVEVRTAQLNGCASSLAGHEREALALGESEERLAALAGPRRSAAFSERELAALELAEALARPGEPALENARRRAAACFEPYELAQLAFACAAASARDRLALALGG